MFAERWTSPPTLPEEIASTLQVRLRNGVGVRHADAHGSRARASPVPPPRLPRLIVTAVTPATALTPSAPHDEAAGSSGSVRTERHAPCPSATSSFTVPDASIRTEAGVLEGTRTRSTCARSVSEGDPRNVPGDVVVGNERGPAEASRDYLETECRRPTSTRSRPLPSATTDSRNVKRDPPQLKRRRRSRRSWIRAKEAAETVRGTG